MNRCPECITYTEFNESIWRFICPNCNWIGYGEDTNREIDIDELVRKGYEKGYIKFNELLAYKLRNYE